MPEFLELLLKNSLRRLCITLLQSQTLVCGVEFVDLQLEFLGLAVDSVQLSHLLRVDAAKLIQLPFVCE